MEKKHELVFATRNTHKIEEARAIVGDRFAILGLDEIGFDLELPENGNTLHENALEKLRTFVEATGRNAISDDSGLEIECLNGRPGVHTAHYSGSRNANLNMLRVLSEMSQCTVRTARFVTVLACNFQGKEFIFEGDVQGVITQEIRGSEGFGYDPIFIPEGYNQTFAELSAQVKNTLSHRAIAFRKLAEWLVSVD
jgi:XTP/dITP diphosphohydrolase